MNKIDRDKIIFQDFDERYIDSIYEIENESLSEAWSKDQLRALIGEPNALARVGICDGEVVCSYSLYVIAGDGYINNLSVKKSVRGSGIGSLMMQDMIDCAKARGVECLTLEVNENNAVAIDLYTKFGFVIEGSRPNFYFGKEAALIMWKRNLQ